MTKKEPTYRQAITEVEKILDQLETSALDVDNMSAAVKRAADLLQLCYKKLHETSAEVEKLLKEKEED
ncbi:MAG: exodeoxyribonuclease VII small subunit [Prevotellaceae bacterium]|jgi:exodeoxyribonuclease VII small subunit|nr:exodeoxyribonuclease VII small subunit [Prevotellaceae bacterium]